MMPRPLADLDNIKHSTAPMVHMGHTPVRLSGQDVSRGIWASDLGGVVLYCASLLLLNGALWRHFLRDL
jgi:hypothetical protein